MIELSSEELCHTSLKKLWSTKTHHEMMVRIKAMDQPGHVTRFPLYRHFSLSSPISIKIKIGNWKFVELRKNTLIWVCVIINVYNYDQTDLP